MKLTKEEFLDRLGENIRLLRQDRKMTQAELAYSIGKNQQSVQRVEKGDFNPSAHYLYELSAGLEVPIEKLFEGIES